MRTITSRRTSSYSPSVAGYSDIDLVRGVDESRSPKPGERPEEGPDERPNERIAWSADPGPRSSTRSPLEFLTPREEEILGLLCEGRSGSEIEKALALRPSTVRSHIQSLLTKLRVHSRLEAVALATHQGFHPRASWPAGQLGDESAGGVGWIPEITPVTVVLLDPGRESRRATFDRLSRDRRLRVVASIDQPESASLSMSLLAGVAIVSGLLDREDAVSLVTRVRERLPLCRIVLVGEREDPRQLFRLLEAGVRGYVPARGSAEELVAAAQAVVQGKVAIPRHLYEPLVQDLLESWLAQRERRALLDRLTKRELEVLQLLVEGGSNESIAQDLTVSVDTARTHVQRILQKLGVHSRVAAAAIAMNQG